MRDEGRKEDEKLRRLEDNLGQKTGVGGRGWEDEKVREEVGCQRPEDEGEDKD